MTVEMSCLGELLLSEAQEVAYHILSGVPNRLVSDLAGYLRSLPLDGCRWRVGRAPVP